MTFDEDVGAALRESEERYRTLFDQAPFGVFVYDRRCIVLDCNEAFVQLLHADFEKLIGFDLRRLRDQRVLPALDRVLEGEPGVYEGPYESATGVVLDVLLRTSPLRDAEGDVVGGLGVVDDITDRQRAVAALRASEQRMKLHVKHSPLGVIVWDEDERIEEWNDAATRIFGYTFAEVAGAGIERLALPDESGSAAERIREFRQRLARGQGMRSTHVHRTKDGRVIHCAWYDTVLIDPRGQTVGVASLVEDITERRSAEAALRESEARFRALIEAAPDPIFVLREGHMVYVNPALAAYVGRDVSSLFGAPLERVVHPDDQAALHAREGGAREGGDPAPPSEIRLLRPDGAVRIAEISSIRVGNAPRDGGCLIFARDVTERRELQTRLRHADRMVSVGTLAAGVAHEVNNPLAYVLANVAHVIDRRIPKLDDILGQLAETSLGRDEHEIVGGAIRQLGDIREMLEIVREGAERVRTIVRDLRSFARAEEEIRRPTDAKRVLEATIALAQNEIRKVAKLEVEINVMPLVLANDGRLSQVFMNILLNAAQAITPGAPRENLIRVTSSTSPSGEARIEVTDTGGGIDPASLEKVFEPFYTTKPSAEGSGLGLWICHGIVTALGGTIEVESSQADSTGAGLQRPGTRVVVTLKAASPAVESEPPLVRSTPRPRRRALAIDPLVGAARIARRALQEAWDLVIAESYEEAQLRLERDDGFDAVLCFVRSTPDADADAFARNLPAPLKARVRCVSPTHTDLESLRTILEQRV